MSDSFEFNDPIAVHARHFAHVGSFGDEVNQIALCTDARTRARLAIALIEWCDQQGWACNEINSGHFLLRSGSLRIVKSVKGSLGAVDITAIPKDGIES